ncbi:MAG: hypothetical protein GWN00_38840, partial [Aliifodinibius sp.]|nr:hypothetical protein [Fodinibius sp.]NIV16554.1 hypothetical protein [Fodinibius sp.]NIY30524.1 hypothetical protein [Fodinibius sp.]
VRVVANNGVIDFQSEFNLLGTHNRYNLACAVAIAANAGLDGKSIENKVCNIKPVVGRLYPKHINDKFLLIDDTYNANPSSVKQALNILSEQAGFKIFIFGDMAELGDKAKKLHEEIGEYATSRNIDYFIAVGDLAKSAFDCFDGDKSFVQDVSEVAALVNKHLSKEICVLVKASRSMHLDKVTEKLLEMAA